MRSECPLSMRSLAQLLDSGLQVLFPERRLPIQSISLGRLMDYPEWSLELADMAAKSPAWNAKRGRPTKSGESDNQRVRWLLNDSANLQLLKPLFAHYGLTACIADVEKVLVFKAKDLFTHKTALPRGLASEARLPFDAQIWLHVQSEGTDCSVD